MAMNSTRWNPESGILRKKGVVEENPQELLVFGYGCKLFRDDERAKLIDQGKHLIPWMGDNALKIDRYDARGALGDLRMYEPPPGGTDYRTVLTEEELRIEQACDEERYKSLYNNEEEESLLHEEEMKRLHQALGKNEGSYNQVGFSYDDEKKNEENSQSPKQSEDSNDDEPFVAEEGLEIPANITIPETKKLNAIIVKTALFISHQGSQMEILIRAKQANNPQFAFLSIDGELHPYYKHILEAIKSGKYNPEKQPEKEEPENNAESVGGDDDDDNDDDCDDTYLHPSLASSLKVELAPSIPSINYKPSKDCAYSMLVNKITGKPPSANQYSAHQQGLIMPQGKTEAVPPPPLPPYGYYPVQQGYQAFPSLPQQYSHGPVLYTSNGSVIQPQMPGAQSTVNPPLPTTTAAQTVQKEVAPLVPYGPTPPKPLSRPSFIVPPADIQIIIDKMASYVAKNGRDFEAIVRSKGDPRFNFLELSHQYHGYYAHKLAIYEGGANPRILTEEEMLQKQEQQEEKNKKLEELQKKQQRMEEVQKRVKMIQEKKKSESSGRDSPGKQITTVSFSIKKPKEGENNVIEKRSALPIEESDDESTEDKKELKPSSPVSAAVLEIERIDKETSFAEDKSVVRSKSSDNKFKQSRFSITESRNSKETKMSTTEFKPDKDIRSTKRLRDSDLKQTEDGKSTRETKIQKKAISSLEDSLPQPISEMVDGDFVDLTIETPEEISKSVPVNKLEEDKNRQRMLIVARKKLAALREKQLQLERRRKAAMFLNQIKDSKIPEKKIPILKEVPATISLPIEAEPKEQISVTSLPPHSNPQLDIDDFTANSLINKLREATKKIRRRSKSRSTSDSSSESSSHSQKRKSHKKHKKRKNSHKSSYRDSSRSSRSHKNKKSKKVSSRHHRSTSRSPYKHHSSRHKKQSGSSDSDTSSS